MDVGGVALDGALAIVPGVPGGVGILRQTARNADNLVDATKGARNLPFLDRDIVTEINKTLDRIDGNGPFPHRRDGIRFRNDEGRLPDGNYKEYTVDTPGASGRGERRIVRDQDTGSTYYTDNHYETFTQIDPTKQ